jgi:hypothetical protein
VDARFPPVLRVRIVGLPGCEMVRRRETGGSDLSPGVYGDGADAFAGEAVEERGGGFDGGGAVGADALLVAVVEKDVGRGGVAACAGEASGDVGDDGFGGDGAPVVTHGVPLDDLEAEFFGGAEDCGAAGSVGRAEIVDGSADGVFEGLVAGAKLFADDAGGLEAEPGVGLGVVANQMTSRVDTADDLGTLAHEAADHEEGGAGVVLGEEVEEGVGGDVVGAVVVGEGCFVGVGAGDDGVAEELGAGAEGGVGESEAGGHGHCGCR